LTFKRFKCFFYRVDNSFLNNRRLKPKFFGSSGRNTSKAYSLSSSPRPGQGLRVKLRQSKDFFFEDKCTSPSFTVHSPFELPGSYDLNDYIQFGFGLDFEVLITPKIIETDADLANLDPVKRGCFFKGEKKLKYFKVYSRRNCEFECLSEALHRSRYLNCTPYYMIRSKSMDHCDYRHEYEMRQEMYYIKEEGLDCFCLDECDSIKYNIEIIANNLKQSNESVVHRYEFEESSFSFRFKDVDIVPLRRYLQFTFTDFLAQSGGMLGLFAGVSMLSIIEVVYFVTLRWIVNMCRWIVRKQV
jgi:acid-sensing ion channel, other